MQCCNLEVKTNYCPTCGKVNQDNSLKVTIIDLIKFKIKSKKQHLREKTRLFEMYENKDCIGALGEERKIEKAHEDIKMYEKCLNYMNTIEEANNE